MRPFPGVGVSMSDRSWPMNGRGILPSRRYHPVPIRKKPEFLSVFPISDPLAGSWAAEPVRSIEYAWLLGPVDPFTGSQIVMLPGWSEAEPTRAFSPPAIKQRLTHSILPLRRTNAFRERTIVRSLRLPAMYRRSETDLWGA